MCVHQPKGGGSDCEGGGERKREKSYRKGKRKQKLKIKFEEVRFLFLAK